MSIHRIAFVIALLLCCTAVSGSPSESQNVPVRWQKLGHDLEIAEVHTSPGTLLSPQLTLLRTSGTSYQLGVVAAVSFGMQRSTVKRLAESSGAMLGINANFFDERGDPLGLVLTGGRLRHAVHRGGKTLTGVLEVRRGGARIVSRDRFSPKGVLEAIQAGPRLIVGSAPVEKPRDSVKYERRAGVCIDRQGRIVFFISSGLIGISFKELIQLLLQSDVGCRDALNLDGGGSAQLYLSSEIAGAVPTLRELSVPGSDQIPVMLALMVKRRAGASSAP